MKQIHFLWAAALVCALPSAIKASETDPVEGSQTLTANYTARLNGLQLTGNNSEFRFQVYRPYNETMSFGRELLITVQRLQLINGTDTVLVADGLTDGMAAHDYTVVFNTTYIYLYRDNVLLGHATEKPLAISPGIRIPDASGAVNGYTVTFDPENAVMPVEHERETQIENMLPSTCPNLVKDPYCNRGFTRTGQFADGRNFYSMEAVFSGWGPNAVCDNDEAYSGNTCIRLGGRAVYPDQGASLDMNINFKANTPYYIRAMVKSDGYTGQIGIQSCSNYIPISDTGNEWKQVEGVLTPSQASTLLFVNNEGFDSNGTLWIDNLEVYLGYDSPSAAGTRNVIPYIRLAATDHWSPRRATTAYCINFTDNGTQHSTIDADKVTPARNVQLTKTVQGSRLYALRFPGELLSATVSGYFDGFTHTDEPLVYGVDYLLQRYEWPRFTDVDGDEPISAGCYIAQFVDNFTDQQVQLTFGPASTTEDKDSPYILTGNPTYADYTPQGRFLKYDEERERFLLTEGASIKPFEAYIATTESAPVQQIAPNGATSIRRTTSTDGTRLSVRATDGGAIIGSPCEGKNVRIVTLDGRVVRTLVLHYGDNPIQLPAGLYIIGQTKIAVR